MEYMRNFKWHVRCTFETFISPSFLKQEMHGVTFLEKPLMKIIRLLLWIRIVIMSAVTINLSIDSTLIKLLCRFVNFEEMKKEI